MAGSRGSVRIPLRNRGAGSRVGGAALFYSRHGPAPSARPVVGERRNNEAGVAAGKAAQMQMRASSQGPSGPGEVAVNGRGADASRPPRGQADGPQAVREAGLLA